MPRLFEFSTTVYYSTLKSLRDAGSKAFSVENWSKLKATAALMKNPPLADIEQVHAEIVRLKKSLSIKESDSFDVNAYSVNWHGVIQPSYRRWQVQQMKLLNDPLWWHPCFEKIEELPVLQRRTARKRLHQLKKDWEWQSAYAHYSTLEVIHIYQTVMPVFFVWLKEAKRELENIKAHLPPDARSFYENYLEGFERAVEDEKALLRRSLHERLVVSLKKGYGAWDNLIESVRDELKRLNVFPPTSTWDRLLPDGHLTPEMFVAIRNVIEEEGSEEEKAKLYALAYYRPLFDKHELFAQHESHPLNRYAHHYRQSRDDIMSIKSTVYRYLPRFLQWLFWDEDVREQFFQHPDYQFLLAQEAAFLNADIKISSTVLRAELFVHPAWQEYQMCFQLLQSERQRIEHWLSHPLAFLFPDTVRQLTDYRKTLEQSTNGWMAKQLLLVKHALVLHDHHTLHPEEKSTFTNAFMNIDAMQKEWIFSPEVLSDLIEIKQRYQMLCNPEETEVCVLPLEDKFTQQSLALRDEFRASVKETIAAFELAQVVSHPKVEELKNSLPIDTATYDSVVLRTKLAEQLEEQPGLPAELKGKLEAILNNPKFAEKLLNREENAALRSSFDKNQMAITVLMQSTALMQLPVEKLLPDLDEDPWDYEQQKFEQHCKTLKDFFAKMVHGLSAEENRKLCRYILRFLEKIQRLPDWEAFLVHRTHIKQLLHTLVEISVGFSALHQALVELTTAEAILDANHWRSFVRTNLSIQIGTLARFIHFSAEKDLTHRDAASYWSQRTLLRAPTENNALKASSFSPQTPIPTL